MKNKNKRQIKETVSVAPAPIGRSTAFNPDYSAVVKDLKRIGILATIFISILIGLAFAMPYILP